MSTPPASTTPSIIHKIRVLYQDVYCISGKFSKRDKLGIHSIIESLCIEILSLAIESAFSPTNLKLDILQKLRVKTNVLKNIVRTEYEIKIIDMKTYLRISEQLVEISKMTNGWINFVNGKEPLKK